MAFGSLVLIENVTVMTAENCLIVKPSSQHDFNTISYLLRSNGLDILANELGS
jgi:hypothetical protein